MTPVFLSEKKLHCFWDYFFSWLARADHLYEFFLICFFIQVLSILCFAKQGTYDVLQRFIWLFWVMIDFW